MTERHPPEQTPISTLRRTTAGVIALASFAVPTTACIEALGDLPDLTTHTQEAGETVTHFQNVYNSTAKHPEGLQIALDQATGRVSVTFGKDPRLNLEPIKESFSSLEDTTDDAKRLKWLALSGALGLAGAAGLGRIDRSLRKGGAIRETAVDISRESPGLFAGLLLCGAVMTSASHLQKDVTELSRLDLERATKISHEIEENLEKLDVTITHAEEHTKVSLLPEPRAIERVAARASELDAMMPRVSDQDLAADKVMLPAIALTLVGAAGTAINAASGVARMARGERRRRYVSVEQRAHMSLSQQGRSPYMTGYHHRGNR